MEIKQLIKFLEKQNPEANIYINCYGKLVIKETTSTFYSLDSGIEKIES